jgi:hypothetical protein
MKSSKNRFKQLKTCSYDIHMEVGLDKCAEITFKRGKLTHSQNLVTDINRVRTRKNVQVLRDW